VCCIPNKMQGKDYVDHIAVHYTYYCLRLPAMEFMTVRVDFYVE